MPVVDDNTVYTETYHLFNARLSYEAEFPEWQLEIYGKVKNITDELYAAMIVPNIPGYGGSPRYFYPGEPRSFIAGIQVGLN